MMLGVINSLVMTSSFSSMLWTSILSAATSDEVSDLRKENLRLKEIVADLVVRYDIVKKTLDSLD